MSDLPQQCVQMLNPSALSSEEKALMQEILQDIVGGAELLGAIRGPNIKGDRIILLAHDEGFPSLLRITSEILYKNQNAREFLEKSFKIAKSSTKLRSSFISCGTHRGSLWYRRKYYPKTLRNILNDNELLPLDSVELSLMLISHLHRWHEKGLFHGHLVVDNIMPLRDKSIIVVDPVISALATAVTHSVSHGVVDEYFSDFFAPELALGRVDRTSDLYSLGMIIPKILSPFFQWFSSNNQISKKKIGKSISNIDKICQNLCSEDPTLRPNLKDVEGEILLLKENFINADVEEEDDEENEEDSDSASTTLRKSLISKKDSVEKERRNLNVWILLLVALLIGSSVLVWRFTSQEKEEVSVKASHPWTSEELSSFWMTSRTSTVARVVSTALDLTNPSRKIAEEIILNAAFMDLPMPKGLDQQFLRLAFDDRWEQDLKVGDRRAALILASSGLHDRISFGGGLPSPGNLHPGILFAIIASAEGGSLMSLDHISASVFANLPGTVGQAFGFLIQDRVERSCSDGVVNFLIRWLSKSQYSTEEVFGFLSEDTPFRLAVLRAGVGGDNSRAAEVLKIVLEHANYKLDHPYAEWAIQKRLMKRSQMNSLDRLTILSGRLPEGDVPMEQIALLFSHPSPSLRSKVLKLALDRIPFKYPSSLDIIKMLIKDPELLNGKQTFTLGRFLAKPEAATEARVKEWLSTGVPVEIVEKILIGGVSMNKQTPFDLQSARYMQSKDWTPNLAVLEKLVDHPEKLTRFSAYMKVFEHIDKKKARDILAKRLKKETDPTFLQRLKSMLDTLKGASEN